MKGKIIGSISVIVCLLAGGVQAVAESADTVVKQTTNSVIDRINSQRAELKASPEKVYDLVNELVIPHFDFVSMSKWVLSKNWKTATDAQRSEFMEQFKTLLVRTYARALLEYSGQEIKFFPAEQKPDSKFAVVKTELTGSGNRPFPVAYRMHQKDDAWKVVDVAVDGVSLISTYRGSFAAQIRKNGFDSLIQTLADKNKKLASNIPR